MADENLEDDGGLDLNDPASSSSDEVNLIANQDLLGGDDEDSPSTGSSGDDRAFGDHILPIEEAAGLELTNNILTSIQYMVVGSKLASFDDAYLLGQYVGIVRQALFNGESPRPLSALYQQNYHQKPLPQYEALTQQGDIPGEYETLLDYARVQFALTPDQIFIVLLYADQPDTFIGLLGDKVALPDNFDAMHEDAVAKLQSDMTQLSELPNSVPPKTEVFGGLHRGHRRNIFSGFRIPKPRIRVFDRLPAKLKPRAKTAFWLIVTGLVAGGAVLGLMVGLAGASMALATAIGVATFIGFTLMAMLPILRAFQNSNAYNKKGVKGVINKGLILGGFALIVLGLIAAAVLPLLMVTGVFTPAAALMLFTLTGPLAILAATATIAGLTILLGMAVLGLSSGRVQNLLGQIKADKKMLAVLGLLFVLAALAVPAIVFAATGSALLPGLGLAGSIVLFTAAALIAAPIAYFVGSRGLGEVAIAIMSVIGLIAGGIFNRFSAGYRAAQEYVNEVGPAKVANKPNLVQRVINFLWEPSLTAQWGGRFLAGIILLWRSIGSVIAGVPLRDVNEKGGAYAAYHAGSYKRVEYMGLQSDSAKGTTYGGLAESLFGFKGGKVADYWGEPRAEVLTVGTSTSGGRGFLSRISNRSHEELGGDTIIAQEEYSAGSGSDLGT